MEALMTRIINDCKTGTIGIDSDGWVITVLDVKGVGVDVLMWGDCRGRKIDDFYESPHGKRHWNIPKYYYVRVLWEPEEQP
jgi:hypothetical protein